MTGTVRIVDVSVGQQVVADDRLVVLEAMKMETALLAPAAGVVEQVDCAVGDAVDGGSVLVRITLEAS